MRVRLIVDLDVPDDWSELEGLGGRELIPGDVAAYAADLLTYCNAAAQGGWTVRAVTGRKVGR